MFMSPQILVVLLPFLFFNFLVDFSHHTDHPGKESQDDCGPPEQGDQCDGSQDQPQRNLDISVESAHPSPEADQQDKGTEVSDLSEHFVIAHLTHSSFGKKSIGYHSAIR